MLVQLQSSLEGFSDIQNGIYFKIKGKATKVVFAQDAVVTIFIVACLSDWATMKVVYLKLYDSLANSASRNNNRHCLLAAWGQLLNRTGSMQCTVVPTVSMIRLTDPLLQYE